jgi:hypothetical protein
MIYKASLDKTAIIITNIITLIFGALIVFNFLLSLAIILLLIYFICLLLKPINYQITEKELIIHRLIKNVHIKRSEIESLEVLEKSALSGSIRIFGVGGLFGWYGRFANKQLGTMTWYVTRRDKPILILTKSNKSIIISPDEVETFVSDFKKV